MEETLKYSNLITSQRWVVSQSYLDQSVPVTVGSRPIVPLALKWEGKKGRVGRWELDPKTEQRQRPKEENLILLNMISECKITQHNTIYFKLRLINQIKWETVSNTKRPTLNWRCMAGENTHTLPGSERERVRERDPMTSSCGLSSSLTTKSPGKCSSSSLLRTRHPESCQSTELEF